MQTLKRSFAMLAVLAATVTLIACNNNPTGVSSGDQKERTEHGAIGNSGKIVLTFENYLMPGEKWNINAAEFDQCNLDAFTAVSVEAIDLRLPAYQTPEHCGDIAIYIDGDEGKVNGKCGADNFRAREITLINNSEMGLSVKATIIGTEAVSDPNGSK
ncbi:MAG: hypothetical protein K1X85_10660 [Ignavibacteria bacterium]|nr:hypothetical protein [Ignavibacteria bacterium]